MNENTQKYRWHDLRKDPKDLPDDKRIVLCYYEHRIAGVGYYELGEYESLGEVSVFPNIDEYNMDYWEVVAWKYIEPFEEEE